MSYLWRAAHLLLLGVLTLWATYSSLLSSSDILMAWSTSLSVVALALGIYGLNTRRGSARVAALAPLFLAYLPAAVATEQPALTLLAFTSLALLAGLVGNALPLVAHVDLQRVVARHGAVVLPGVKLLGLLVATTVASFLLSVVLIQGGLLLTLGGPSELSALVAALAALAVVAMLATLPRGWSKRRRPQRYGKG